MYFSAFVFRLRLKKNNARKVWCSGKDTGPIICGPRVRFSSDYASESSAFTHYNTQCVRDRV